MDLRAFLARHEGFRLASPQDNEALLRFFTESPMEGRKLSLRYERDPDFFSFLKMQSPDAFVLVGESAKTGKIAAVGTVSVRRGQIAGQPATVGYLGDLRLGTDRRLTLRWRALYGELLAASGDIEELKGCRHFLTAVIDENKAALQALTARPDSPYSYRELARYRMVNVLGRAPWARKAGGNDRIERGTASVIPELVTFLDGENRGKAFGFQFQEELPRRLSAWPELKAESFFVARSASGEIVGCFAPWSPSPAKRIVAEKMPITLRAVCGAMSLIRGDAPSIGREVRISYLTHLEIKRSLAPRARARVLRALLARAYQARSFDGAHLVAFADFERSPLVGGLSGFFTQQTPMTLYQVLPRAQAGTPELLQIGDLPPAFEMALV